MLTRRLDKAWVAQRNSTAIDSVMRFAEEGLVLGAGTIVAKSAGELRRISIDPAEPRLRALLAATHLRSPTVGSLAHLRKAAQRWSEGQDALAATHLALSGLERLQRPELDAYRLFLADAFMKAGLEPSAIIAAIEAGDVALDQVQKYSPDQPRVPAGSGRTSGEWTSTGDGSASVPQRPQVNPSTVTEAALPLLGSVQACEEAESDCVKAAINASRNDAANDNSRFLDLKNCSDAGTWCDRLSWVVEDLPLPLRAGVRFPHGGVVLIDKGQPDRYLPPLFGRPPPIKRTSDQPTVLGEELLKSTQDGNLSAEDYSCPPWTPTLAETISHGRNGFSARLKPIALLSSYVKGSIAVATCSQSEHWGKIVRAKIVYERQRSPAAALVTCWSQPGSDLNVDLKLECCCAPNDRLQATAAVR